MVYLNIDKFRLDDTKATCLQAILILATTTTQKEITNQ